MKRVVAMMLLVVGTMFAQQFETIRIPTKQSAATMPIAERRELEIIFGTSVEEALVLGKIVPGQYIDFRNPETRFVRHYNLWVEMRIVLVKKFGLRIFRDAIDIKEMTQFDRTTTAWADYCEATEEQYRQFKRANRAYQKLVKSLEQERDGVYR